MGNAPSPGGRRLWGRSRQGRWGCARVSPGRQRRRRGPLWIRPAAFLPDSPRARSGLFPLARGGRWAAGTMWPLFRRHRPGGGQVGGTQCAGTRALGAPNVSRTRARSLRSPRSPRFRTARHPPPPGLQGQSSVGGDGREPQEGEPGLPTRMQAEEAPLSLAWGTSHNTRAPSWATGLSQRTLPLAPDTAAIKEQGEEKPGEQSRLWGCARRPCTASPPAHLAPCHSPYCPGSFPLHRGPFPTPDPWGPSVDPMGIRNQTRCVLRPALSLSSPTNGRQRQFTEIPPTASPKHWKSKDSSSYREFLLLWIEIKLPSSAQDWLKLLLPLVFL